MRICVWSGSSFEEWYSSFHLMLELIKIMLTAGHEVFLVQVQRADGKMPEDLQGQGNLHVINIPQSTTEKGNFAKRYVKGFQYYRESGKKVRAIQGLNVIFLQSNNNAIVPVNIAKKIGVPVLYNVQDVFPMDAMVIGKLPKKHPAFIVCRWLQASAYKRADRVVTISEDLAKTIRTEGRCDVDVIYNWSYQNDPYDISDNQNHFLTFNGIKREDGFRVVYAGNVGQMMENEMIVRSAAILRDYKDIKFYIIGEGSDLEKFKSRVAEEGLTNVLFYGFQPMEYAQDNYCAADVIINPVPKGVIYTCMPSKTATCLLSQKPTVVSMDLDSDMAKRLSDIDQWTVISPGDAKAMADAILKYYKAEDWNVKSKNAGMFLANLGPIENAGKYVRILEQIARK